MTITEAVEIAREWTASGIAREAGYRGVLLHGSVCYLPPGQDLPAESDTDVITVWDSEPRQFGKLEHADTVLDVCGISLADFGTADLILGNHIFAGPFAAGLVVDDPAGILAPLASSVVAEFREPRWIRARVEQALSKANAMLDRVRADPMGEHGAVGLMFAAGQLVHALLVAACDNPTVRRRYEAASELLAPLGMEDVHDRLLDLLGSRALGREECERHFHAMQAAYDAAIQVPDPPGYFANHVSRLARKGAIGGTRRSLESGFHREAMFFTGTCFTKALGILEPVMDAEQFQVHAGAMDAVLGILGICSEEERRDRIRLLRESVPRIREIAEQIINSNGRYRLET